MILGLTVVIRNSLQLALFGHARVMIVKIMGVGALSSVHGKNVWSLSTDIYSTQDSIQIRKIKKGKESKGGLSLDWRLVSSGHIDRRKSNDALKRDTTLSPNMAK